MYCKRCGYNLLGVKKYCPECGGAFDSSDPSTTHSYPWFSKIKTIRRVTVLFIVLMCLFLAFFIYYMGSYFATDYAYNQIRVGMSQGDLNNELGWMFSPTTVSWNDVEPIYHMPGSAGIVERRGLWPYYFYVVYENNAVSYAIPAHE